LIFFGNRVDIGSGFHYANEFTLNNENLSQFLPDRNVLWMTLEHLFEIFIKLPMMMMIAFITIKVV